MVTEWLKFCQEHHTNPACWVPNLKVIDCETRQIVALQDCQDSYVTLSYVWGPNEVVTSDSNALPQETTLVIEDAIHVVKALGFRYLWVDRYCVPQSDEYEKLKCIQRMGNIYENSALTIVAAAGEDPSCGLPGVGKILRDPQPVVRVGSHDLVSSLDIVQEIHTSNWNSRGWTYQEALLSRRCLVFTKTQIYFQCAVMHCVESIYAPLDILHTINRQRYRHDVKIPRVFPSRRVGIWPSEIQLRVSEYCRRSLSFEHDSFRAFQGILQAFEKMQYPLQHLYGVPVFHKEYLHLTNRRQYDPETERLVIGLLWNITGPAVRRSACPSWTWAGWKLDKSSSWNLISGSSNPKKISLSGIQVEIRVKVEFDHGEVMLWESCTAEILRKCEEGHLPLYLRIWGWVFDIELSKRKTGWRLEKPRACQAEHRWPARIVSASELQMTKEQEKNGHFIGMITRTDAFDLMLLVMVQQNSTTAYERVGVINVTLSTLALELDEDSGYAAGLGLQLERREIRLG